MTIDKLIQGLEAIKLCNKGDGDIDFKIKINDLPVFIDVDYLGACQINGDDVAYVNIELALSKDQVEMAAPLF